MSSESYHSELDLDPDAPMSNIKGRMALLENLIDGCFEVELKGYS